MGRLTGLGAHWSRRIVGSGDLTDVAGLIGEVLVFTGRVGDVLAKCDVSRTLSPVHEPRPIAAGPPEGRQLRPVAFGIAALVVWIRGGPGQ